MAMQIGDKVIVRNGVIEWTITKDIPARDGEGRVLCLTTTRLKRWINKSYCRKVA